MGFGAYRYLWDKWNPDKILEQNLPSIGSNKLLLKSTSFLQEWNNNFHSPTHEGCDIHIHKTIDLSCVFHVIFKVRC